MTPDITKTGARCQHCYDEDNVIAYRGYCKHTRKDGSDYSLNSVPMRKLKDIVIDGGTIIAVLVLCALLIKIAVIA